MDVKELSKDVSPSSAVANVGIQRPSSTVVAGLLYDIGNLPAIIVRLAEDWMDITYRHRGYHSP